MNTKNENPSADLGKLIKFVPALLALLYTLRKMTRSLHEGKEKP